MAGKFQPDEVITSIRVQVHTANRSGAGTDSDVFVELFDPSFGLPAPFMVEIDTADHDDFEAGETDWYDLPNWYFAGRIIHDIVRIRVHKGDGWGSDWCFGWISVWVNGREFYTSPNMATSPDQGIWLTDGTYYTEQSFIRVEFTQPLLVQDGLPDAGADQNYSARLDTVGGRKPIKWFLGQQSGGAFTSGLTVTPIADTNGVSALLTGHTAKDNGNWSAELILLDADGRESAYPLSMRTILKLPPPTIKAFSPAFGWPGLSPGAPDPVTVTIESNGQDFDSRSNGFTKVFFSKAGGTVEAKVIQKTSTKVHALVPNGAVTGPITVETPFGKVSSKKFTVHPNGYRFLHGFSFRNANEDKQPGSGFPTSFAWQRFEETFGMDEMWLTAFDQAVVPNPIATCFYSLARLTAGSGCCHGFCLTALQLDHGILPSTAFSRSGNFYPLSDSLWDFAGPSGAPDAISHYVQDRQLVVYSDEGMSYFLNQIDSIGVVGGDPCEMDARTALSGIRSALAGNLDDPVMLAFARRCWPWEGHVVVPYQIDEGAKSFLHLYNPNQPANPQDATVADTQLAIRDQDGDWSFQWEDNSTWRGLYIFTIPLSQYGHQLDWSIPGLSTLLATVGTFVLGCAGADVNGEITQIRDDAGLTLFNPRNGQLITDRKKWPQGIRPSVQFGGTDTQHHVFAIGNKASATFSVRPNPHAGGLPACLHVVAGSDLALSAEDLNAPHEVHFDAAALALRVAPGAGSTSPVLRITQRQRETSESISYAVRARDTAAGSPIELALSGDRKGCTVRAAANDRMLDVEITHTNRIGQVRVFETDGIKLAAKSVATLHITRPEELDLPGTRPLVLELDPDGTGSSSTRLTFASKIDGLAVVAPARVIAPAPAAAGLPQPVSIDLSKSHTRGAVMPVSFRVVDGPAASLSNGKLLFNAPKGNQPVRIVAEDAAGHRSFARTVFISAPERDQHPVPLYTVYSQDAQIAPGGTASLGFSAWVDDLAATGLDLVFSTRQRLSGLGEDLPEILAAGLTLSPALQAVGATQTVTTAGGTIFNIKIRWNASKPLSGAIDLGTLQVSVPSKVPLGSAFVLRGGGSVVTGPNAKPVLQPAKILPVLLKVWGGVEPSAFSIIGPESVSENASIDLHVSDAVDPNASNIGWWVEKISGQVSAAQYGAKRNTAAIRGVRAGYVRVKAVVGTTTAEKIIKVQAARKPRVIGISRPLLKALTVH